MSRLLYEQLRVILIVASTGTFVNKLSTPRDANRPLLLILLRISINSFVQLIEYFVCKNVFRNSFSSLAIS